jgi:hypothetical protein
MDWDQSKVCTDCLKIWKSVREATIYIAHTHLVSLDSSDHKEWQKKAFYKHQFPVQWDNTMRELKKMAPGT